MVRDIFVVRLTISQSFEQWDRAVPLHRASTSIAVTHRIVPAGADECAV